jgi:predicted nucleic acid-binding protein
MTLPGPTAFPHASSTTPLGSCRQWSDPKEETADYQDILVEMTEASGGGVITPPRTVHDCPDHEDNLVLDLAAEVGALLIVSEDNDLTSMSPWRGVPILRASQFVGRVDAMRRHRRT